MPHPNYKLSLPERLWTRVEKSEVCWIVTGQPGRRYPGLKIPRTRLMISAHRLSWILHFGPIPDAMCVCHRCDNTRCVRPDHLFLGTSQENTADKVAKGRQATGERINSKLTPDDVRAIREMWATDGSLRMKDIAAIFGVSDSCIEFVVNRVSWKHVA